MAVYVLFTAFLYQKGSSESKTPGTTERVEVIAESSRTIRGRRGPFVAAACG